MRRRDSGATRSCLGQVGRVDVHHAASAVLQTDKVTPADPIGNPNDAFWLAQTHFLTGHYLRAERLLTEPLPLPPNALPPRRNGYENGRGKGKGRVSEDEDMNGHDGIANGYGDVERRTSGRLVDESLACRYLAAQCLVGDFRWFSPSRGEEEMPR